MTTITEGLELTSSERVALTQVGSDIARDVSGRASDGQMYDGDVSKMLEDADKLTNAARVTFAAETPTLDPGLWGIVRAWLPSVLQNTREVVADAAAYTQEIQDLDAAVLEGLLSLEARLGGVTS